MTDFFDDNLDRLLKSAHEAPAARTHIVEAAIARGFQLRRRRALSTTGVVGALALVAGILVQSGSAPAVLPSDQVIALASGSVARTSRNVLVRAESDSRLEVVQNEESSAVRLLSGDVLLDVPHGEDFSVLTAAGEFAVLGTRFQVRSDYMSRGEGIRLSLVSAVVFVGTVMFMPRTGPSQVLEPSDVLIALPGQEAERLTLAEVTKRMQASTGAEQQSPALAGASPSAVADASPTSDPPLRTGVDGLDWDAVASAVLQVHADVREGRALDPTRLSEVGRFYASLAAAREELGLGAQDDPLGHPEVQARLVAAIAQALAPELPEEEGAVLIEQAREIASARAATRPDGGPRLLRVEHALRTSDALHDLMGRRIGSAAASPAAGLVFGSTRDIAYGTLFFTARSDAELQGHLHAYLHEGAPAADVDLNGLVADWAHAIDLDQHAAEREFGHDLARAAYRDPDDGLHDEALVRARSDPGFKDAQSSIMARVRATQARYESRYYDELTDTQRQVYDRMPPDVLLIWRER